MDNVVLNKMAKSVNEVIPYRAKRAVDGSIRTQMRWLSNQVPDFFAIDLGKTYWIDRWVVHNLGVAGWKAPDFNMMAYRLEGSLDGVNWYVIDGVDENQLSITDRKFHAIQARKVRLNVTRGIKVNPKVASCMELEVYEAQSTSDLQSLQISVGTLSPAFDATKLTYTDMVDYDVKNITVTPISIEGGVIKVNGKEVKSGDASQPIDLEVGKNTITIESHSRISDLMQTYIIVVTRAINPWLKSLVIKNNDHTVLKTIPDFNPTIMEYQIDTEYDYVSTPGSYKIIINTLADSGATIMIDDVNYTEGQATTDETLVVGEQVVGIKVSTHDSIVEKDYQLKFVRASNNYLGGLSITNISNLTPKFSGNCYEYTADANYRSVKVTPRTNFAGQVEFTVNNNSVKCGNSITVDLPDIVGSVTQIVIEATSTIGKSIKKYTVQLTRTKYN